MAVFGVEIEEDVYSLEFIRLMRERLAVNSLGRNPFESHVWQKSPGIYAIKLLPLFPPFYYIGLGLMAAAWIFNGLNLTAWMLPGAFISMTFVFWHPSLYYWMFVWGIRKGGYMGKIRRLSIDEIFSE